MSDPASNPDPEHRLPPKEGAHRVMLVRRQQGVEVQVEGYANGLESLEDLIETFLKTAELTSGVEGYTNKEREEKARRFGAASARNGR